MVEKTKPTISFFCPAYYDEDNLPALIPKVVEFLEKAAADYEVVIIEDGSPDDTGRVADELAARYKKVRVVHHTNNLGYGAALKRGFAEANRFDYTVYTDGDAQFDVFEFDRLIALAEHADVAVGYRKVRRDPASRRFQSAVFNQVCRTVFGVRVRDVNAAFKLYKRAVVDSMTITSDSATINAEMLAKAARQGFTIAEVAVTHYPRAAGAASGGKPSVIIGTIKELAACRREIASVPKNHKTRSAETPGD